MVRVFQGAESWNGFDKKIKFGSGHTCGIKRMSSKINFGLIPCTWVQKRVRLSEKVKDKLISKSLGRRHEKLVNGESNWKRKNCSFLLRSSLDILACVVFAVLSAANELDISSRTLIFGNRII